MIHNCLDNRPEGVILPQFQSGLMNIPAYVDYGYSVYRLFDNPQVQDIRDHLLKAHGYFAQAKKIHDAWEEIYISHMNFSRLNQFGSEDDPGASGRAYPQPQGDGGPSLFWRGNQGRPGGLY